MRKSVMYSVFLPIVILWGACLFVLTFFSLQWGYACGLFVIAALLSWLVIYKVVSSPISQLERLFGAHISGSLFDFSAKLDEQSVSSIYRYLVSRANTKSEEADILLADIIQSAVRLQPMSQELHETYSNLAQKAVMQANNGHSISEVGGQVVP